VHELVVAALQAPPPSQVRAALSVEVVQLWGAHCVPVAKKRQAPLPSQLPSKPQLVEAAAVHSFAGSWPAGTAAQVPTVPVRAHDRQIPVHAVAQQTP
jgi:hypothetical protein